MKKFIMILVVATLPATTMAATWSGLGGDWKGFTNVWDASSNWEGTENEWLTDRWSIDPGDVAMYGGTYQPTITDGMDTIGGWVRMRNGAVVTQTGGSHEWANGTGNANTVYMYNGAQWNTSGGLLTVRGVLQIGYNQGTPDSAASAESVNISGDGIVQILKMTWGPDYPLNLLINNGSQLTIADAGKLIVDMDLQPTVDGLIASGKIVGIGNLLTTLENGTNYEVFLVPEPAALALLGLGGLSLIRRRRA